MKLRVASIVTFAGLGVFATGARAQSAQTIDCRTLAGSGSFSDPLRIGVISGTTLVRGCPGLSSGTEMWRPAFHIRYYTFDLMRHAATGAVIGMSFVSRGSMVSAVHPRLASTSGTTLATSRQNGAWWKGSGATMRYLPVAGLIPGRYVLGAEKLNSPLRSVTTASFDIVILLP